jgi:hypothetical protein
MYWIHDVDVVDCLGARFSLSDCISLVDGC